MTYYADGSDPIGFLAGGGEMGKRIRQFDWADTVLGPIEAWPQSLRSALSICINSNFPIAIYWGTELVLLYNDQWSPIPGSKHPWALGRTAQEAWPEIWHIIEPLFHRVMNTGEATRSRDQLLPMRRYGFTEECYFDYTFSPIRGESGAVEGVFNAVLETTTRVIGERRLSTLRELGDRKSGEARTASQACLEASKIFSENPFDLPFVLIYLLDDSGEIANLVSATGLSDLEKARPVNIDLNWSEQVWPLQKVASTGKPVEVSNLKNKFGDFSSGAWPEAIEHAVVLPMSRSGTIQLAGFIVAGISPRLELNDEYRGFFELLAGYVAASVASARAYEQERKRAEALAELDRAKTAFFSNVSHEFRTPLTLMLGPVDDVLADAETPVSINQREQLDLVRRNGLRLQRLVNSLLDFSRIEAGRVRANYEPTDISEFTIDLASNFRSACERAGLTLRVNCPPIDEPVFLDRSMWEKIVLNLISNAFKFTFEGEISIALRKAGDSAELKVQDTGTGIPEIELPRLFERFHRVENARGRTHEGSGIGLALVQELVKLHGGAINAESNLGQGTTFIISIPFGVKHLPNDQIGDNPKEASSTIGATPFVEEALRWLPDAEQDGIQESLLPTNSDDLGTPTQHTNRPKILIADDNADMRRYMTRLLSTHYDATAVSNGQEALDSVLQQVPDLIISDVMMPNLDGFQLLEKLRTNKQLADLPFILLSARAGEESRVEGMQAGADDYLVKPFSSRELLARIDSLLQVTQLRREADESLRESESQLRVMANSMPQLAWITGSSGEVIWYNDRWYEFTGSTFDQVQGWGWQILHDPDILPQVVVNWKNSVATGEPFEMEFPLRSRDGSYRWFLNLANPFKDEKGNIIRWFGTSTDIHETRASREILTEETRVLEILNATASQFAAQLDLRELVQIVTDAATKLIGAAFGAFFYNVTDGNGESFLLYTLSGAPREAFEKLGLPRNTPIFETTFRGLGVLRSEDITRDVRYGTMAPHFGMPKGHLPVRSYLAVPVIARSGTVIGGLFFGHPEVGIFDERDERLISGLASHAAIAIDNATLYEQLKQSNSDREQLLDAERAARSEAERVSIMKDEFLATLSHELRTPLNSILGWSQILTSGMAREKDVKEGLDVIQRNARAQAQLIEDLLDMSRIISGKVRLDLQRINLGDVVEAAVASVRPSAEAKGIRLQVIIDPLAGPVSADLNRLQQVIWNLLSNSVKFTPKEGKISIFVERVNSHLEITVNDSGAGIDPEFLPYIFERFRQADSSTTRRYGGLGLGLSIVKQLTELHGGSIRAKSAGLDKGSTFIVSLPLAPVRDQKEHVHPASDSGLALDTESIDLSGIKILIVDDEPDARLLIQRVLSETKATVIAASNADEAFEMLKKERPNILVSDIGMPVKDGYQLIRDIRKLSADLGGSTPAIALTAFARSEDRTRAMLAGYQVHGTKPIEPQELLVTIASLVGRTGR